MAVIKQNKSIVLTENFSVIHAIVARKNKTFNALLIVDNISHSTHYVITPKKLISYSKILELDSNEINELNDFYKKNKLVPNQYYPLNEILIKTL